ncbi:MAG: lysostaphin resistance A-like protein [Halorientalis sp.]
MSRTARSLRALGVCFGLTLTALFGSAGLVVGASTTAHRLGVSFLGTPLGQILLSLVLVQGVTFSGLSIVYLSLSDMHWPSVRVPTYRDGAWIIGGVVAMFAAMWAILWILRRYDIHSAPNDVSRLGLADPRVFLVLIPAAFLIVGPGEELLFRGVIQSRLRESFSSVWAIGIATLLFAGTHALSLVGSIQARITTITTLFVGSLVLGIAYERTNNLVVSSVIHSCYDALLFGLAYWSVR